MSLLCICGIASAAEQVVGHVHGIGRSARDTEADCCATLNTLHPWTGNASDMDRTCQAMGGNAVQRLQARPGTCTLLPSSGPYKLECTAPMVGDCVKR